MSITRTGARHRNRNETFAAVPCGGAGGVITQGKARAGTGSTRVRYAIGFGCRENQEEVQKGRIGIGVRRLSQ